METPKKVIRNNPHSVFVGHAAEDLAPNSVVLPVICPELIPNTAFGTLAAGITQGVISLKDRDGNSFTSQITSSNHLVATWIGESNLKYPPLVRKGEPVEISRTGNQDKFYWRTTGRGREFRTTDRIHVEIGATDASKPGLAKDDTNTYSAYLDSDQQRVGIKTSAVNGESTAFSMEADLAAGTFHISDNNNDPGNRIFLDTGSVSGTPVFQVNLSSGATFKFEADNAFIKIPGKLVIDTGERLIINSPLMIFNLANKGEIIINAANVAVNTAKDFVVSAGNVMGINAAATKIGGVLVAAAIRSANVVKGIGGSLYKPTTVTRPEESQPISTSNSADTNMSGVPYRAP